jgi:hypothetical protein
MFFCRIIKFWFLVLIFPRKGQSRLILHLLVPKPPRLMKAKTEMMPKNLEKRVALLCRLPLLSPKWKSGEKEEVRWRRSFHEYLY